MLVHTLIEGESATLRLQVARLQQKNGSVLNLIAMPHVS